MNSTFPLISIITPCLNRRQYIREAVESVLRQDYPHIEHIVIDGGSTDGTLDVLSNYPHLRVISEPDKNLYDGINKGIRLAKGEIIGHLNSDDLYTDNVFREIVSLFQEYPEAEAICGGACVFEDNPEGRNRRIVSIYEEPENLIISIKSVTLLPPLTNAKFFYKSVYRKAGFYDTSYSIAADREFLLRLAIKGVKTVSLEKVVYNYRQHPGSLTIRASSPQHAFRKLKEYLLISEAFLEDYGSSEGEIPYPLRRWHTVTSLKLFSLLMSQKRHREGLSLAIKGFKYDRLWPMFLSNYLLRYVVARLSRLWRI
jgi:glycosyltransferase involved in cell wall biosynthesis